MVDVSTAIRHQMSECSLVVVGVAGDGDTAKMRAHVTVRTFYVSTTTYSSSMGVMLSKVARRTSSTVNTRFRWSSAAPSIFEIECNYFRTNLILSCTLLFGIKKSQESPCGRPPPLSHLLPPKMRMLGSLTVALSFLTLASAQQTVFSAAGACDYLGLSVQRRAHGIYASSSTHDDLQLHASHTTQASSLLSKIFLFYPKQSSPLSDIRPSPTTMSE